MSADSASRSTRRGSGSPGSTAQSPPRGTQWSRPVPSPAGPAPRARPAAGGRRPGAAPRSRTPGGCRGQRPAGQEELHGRRPAQRVRAVEEPQPVAAAAAGVRHAAKMAAHRSATCAWPFRIEAAQVRHRERHAGGGEHRQQPQPTQLGTGHAGDPTPRRAAPLVLRLRRPVPSRAFTRRATASRSRSGSPSSAVTTPPGRAARPARPRGGYPSSWQ